MIMMKDLFWWFVELIEIGIAWHVVELFSLSLIFPKIMVVHQKILNSEWDSHVLICQYF